VASTPKKTRSKVVHHLNISIDTWAAIALTIYLTTLKRRRLIPLPIIIREVLSASENPLDFYSAEDLMFYADHTKISGTIPLSIHLDTITNDKIREARNQFSKKTQTPVTTLQIIRLIIHSTTNS
jgi:hypothetical protein